MNVYEVRHDREHFEWLGAEGLDRRKWLECMNFTPLGQPVRLRWTPLQFSSTDPKDEDYRGVLPTGDFVGLNPEFGLAPGAMAEIGEIMACYGELLPIDHPGRTQPLYWFHCTTVIDAMDESRSVLKRYPNGKISGVKRLWVYPDKLRDAMLFHIPQNGAFLLCTDTFKQHIEALGLTGLKFMLNWSDEPAGMKQISDREQRALVDMPPFPVPIC